MTTIKPNEYTYTTRVRGASPLAISLARRLGGLFGRGIRGRVGTVRYGAPAIGTRAHFLGYADPPQLFKGYSASKVAGGSFRGTGARLPSTAAANGGGALTPLQRSMAIVTDAQTGS